ncbi:hypothetical protein BGZ65_007232 [Modicella reniformis]|uniref:F-box domain-containing protein n=1 Tax=Modicella reniformis TaxID=1440133 RepID=A0A9P6JH05_9FUNG|nr:hypothetical protein BGZ65_007232 [Modicella reniformis]
MSNVFDIPEILDMIANNLDLDSQIKCLRVCKVFYTAIVPKVWRCAVVVLHTSHTRPGAERAFPSLEELERHKHHIQGLAFVPPVPEYLQLRGFCQLNILKFFGSLDTTTEALDKAIVGLAGFIIAHSSTLHKVLIDFSHYGSPSIPRILWSALGQCSQLEGIHLIGMTIPVESYPLFLQMCAKTIHLEFSDLNIPAWRPVYQQHNENDVSNGSSDDLVFTGPERLELMILSSDPNPTLAGCNWGMIIRHFCNLRYLTLREHDVDRNNAFFQTLSKEPWTLPSLHDLDVSLAPADDTSLAGLIRQMHQLVTLFALGSQFGPLSFKALTMPRGCKPNYANRLCESIEVLNLVACDNVTSAMVQTLLENCPKLLVLFATKIDMTDIAHGQEWVCGGLSIWYIHIDTDGQMDEQDPVSKKHFAEMQRNVFSRLGKMTRMKRLSLTGHNGIGIGKKKTLDLRLGAGLELLSGSHNLQELSFQHDTEQQIGVQEISWITQHWRRLNCVYGRLNGDDHIVEEMKAILEARDVTLMSPDDN